MVLTKMALSALKRAGYDHAVINNGGGPECGKVSELNWVSTIIGNVNNSFRSTFHANSEELFAYTWQYFVVGSTDAFWIPISRFGYIAVRTQPSISRKPQ